MNASSSVTSHALRYANSLGLSLRVMRRDRASDHEAAREPIVLLIAEPSLLALVPVQHSAQRQLDDLLAFSDRFLGFSSHQRRWTWSSVLAVRLELALHAIAMLLASPPEGASSSVYLHVNGSFRRKYYPSDCDASQTDGGLLADTCSTDCREDIGRRADVLRVFGPDSTQNSFGGATPECDSYYVYNEHFDIVGIGRGNTDQAMVLGAALEFAERWVATGRPASVVVACHDALSSSALQPHELWGIPEHVAPVVFPGFAPTQAMEWIPVSVQPSGLERLAPLELINYLVDAPTPITPHRNSSGCALGNSPAEAALFAALEVIERDALLLAWYSRSAPPRFRLASLSHSLSQELLRLFAMRGYEVAVFDATTEFEVPSCVVVLSSGGADRVANFVTAASHPNPCHAVHDALAEAHSLIGAAERTHREHRTKRSKSDDARFAIGPRDPQYLHYTYADVKRDFDFLLRAPESVEFDDYVARHSFAACTPKDAYRDLCERVADAGYELIVCDNTPQSLRALRLFSARVYIPGTINLVFGTTSAHIPPTRFATAARHLAWVTERAVPPNLPPHPLG